MSEQAEDAKVIELLRTPGLSIKYLDEENRERIRAFLVRNHVEKGVSLGDVAKMIGNKTSGYTSWLARQLDVQPRPFEEARLKGIREKVRKYERKPFDGSEGDKAYLLAMRHGDLSAYRPFGDAVRVSTSTTHPEMVKLFRSLFERYGHVYQHPRYKKDTCSYEWNLQVILDPSFEFIIQEIVDSRDWILASDDRILGYVAGLVDAEGNIGFSRDKKNTSLMVAIYNTDTGLLQCAKEGLQKLGYRPVGPYLDKEAGFRSPGYGIEMKKDYWKIVLARFDEAQSVLKRLPLAHPEKVAKKSLALSLNYREPWEKVEPRVTALRDSVVAARDEFVKLAETEYIRTHPENENIAAAANDSTAE
jgi:hypothetical protein